MKRPYVIGGILLLSLLLPSCVPEAPDTSLVSGSFTEENIDQYMEGLKETSKGNHLYIHYLRHENSPASYQDWDLWVWQMAPEKGEGAKFDWAGRTTSGDKLSASGNATIDAYGGAYVEIDLGGSYDGGWNSGSKSIGGVPVSYMAEGEPAEKIGVQIVESKTRTEGSGFWRNDGGDQSFLLEDVALENKDGSTSYHAFLVQDAVEKPSARPHADVEDPFADDDGTNVTYGNEKYSDVDWTETVERPATSPLFLKGEGASSEGTLSSGAGVGYQIMVSSFADSDGDGFGDIYGITSKLDYLEELGVEVLWLTPIQLSDSYHGYDISDYTQVDPKFGSKASPNCENGLVTASSAMEDYKDLLEEAHSRGMAVVMDLVINHTSKGNVWFLDSAQLSEDYRGFYQWGNHETDPEHISEERFWYPYGDHPYSYYAKFGSGMPELNYSYVATREAVVTMARQWCEIGVDGFRIDAVKHIFMDDEVERDPEDTIILDVSTNPETGRIQDYSSNLTKNLHFWQYLIGEVKKTHPDCFFVGENFDGHAYHVAPFYEGFDSMFDFYTYYNLTNGAAHALRNGEVGGAVANWGGAYSSGSGYSAASDTDPNKGLAGNTGEGCAIQYGGGWDIKSVYEAYERYRSGGEGPGDGYTFLGGSFTSNHDISRLVNRIAGTRGGGNSDISEQGRLTEETYGNYLPSATLVAIAELMLPGLTWVYYGDELGMSGNYEEGATSQSDYSDLSYRQPMKWVQGGEPGDGSMTTGYGVTGSYGKSVALDELNSSSLVPSVEEREGSSTWKAYRDAMRLKASSATLTRGNYVPVSWDVQLPGGGNQPAPYVLHFLRTLGEETYEVVINFHPTAKWDVIALEGECVLSYGGASEKTLPPLSAVVVRR